MKRKLGIFSVLAGAALVLLHMVPWLMLQWEGVSTPFFVRANPGLAVIGWVDGPTAVFVTQGPATFPYVLAAGIALLAAGAVLLRKNKRK